MDTFDIPLLMLILALTLPWLGLLLASQSRVAPWIRRGLPLAPAVYLLPALFPPAGQLELPWLLLGSQFGVDEVNRVFVGVTALAWFAASVLAVSFLGTAARSTRFLIFFLLAMAGNFALVLSQDAISFFTGFAVMSLAAYGLVNQRGDAASTFAGKVYIVLAITGELLLFAGLLGLVHSVGEIGFPLDFDTRPPGWAIACTVLGFGVKAGMLPLHMSIPLSYNAAPLPAGVALAGAMLNAGLLGWLRWLPLGSVELDTWGMLFIAAGFAGAACGVVLGILQRAPRALLGYSSISQVGLMMLFIGAGMLAPDQWSLVLPFLTYFVLHHALAKTALFCASSGRIPAVGPRWLWWFAFSLAALALVGVPFSSGYFAKAGLKEVMTAAGVDLGSLVPCLTLATVGTTLLMVRWLYLVMRARPLSLSTPASVGLAPWLALAFTVLVLAWPLLAPSLWGATPAVTGDLLAGAWPVILAMAVAGGVWHYRPSFLAALVGSMPIGDIAGIMGSCWSALRSLARLPGPV
jgi:multicomponent Na+:H+ antiporter subunit D